MSMRIVFLRTNRIDPDPRVEKEINSLLKIKDFKIEAVVWDRGEQYSIKQRDLVYQNGKIKVHQFGIPASWGGGMKRNFFPMIKFEIKLFWWLLTHHKEYDTIHACDLLTGLPAVIPCKLFKKKMVYDIFDYYADTQHGPDKILKLFSKLENRIINFADATIICSEQRKKQIKGTHPKKLIILHNAPSKVQLETREHIELQSKKQGVIRVVYVGNLVGDRYLKECIEAIKRMKYMEFHIGGYGALENYIINQAKENDNIFFYGKLLYDQVISLEKQCDIMVALYDPAVPNHTYAAPNKFYEALALGRPVVMFKNTGMDEVISKNKIGAVCEPSMESLHNAFAKLEDDKDKFEYISEKEVKLFKDNYAWEIMEIRLINMYKNL